MISNSHQGDGTMSSSHPRPWCAPSGKPSSGIIWWRRWPPAGANLKRLEGGDNCFWQDKEKSLKPLGTAEPGRRVAGSVHRWIPKRACGVRWSLCCSCRWIALVCADSSCLTDSKSAGFILTRLYCNSSFLPSYRSSLEICVQVFFPPRSHHGRLSMQKDKTSIILFICNC